MPLVQFMLVHTHDGTEFTPGEKTTMQWSDARSVVSRGVAFIVNETPTELEQLEAQSLVSSKKSNCCFR